MPSAPTWKEFLNKEMSKAYMQKVQAFLDQEIASGKTIFPPAAQIFNAFDKCSFEQIKVVILGQDPYHQAKQANGLAFSVQKGVKIPPSLVNIFKALKNQYPDYRIPSHGDLSEWAEQGVFLLNTSLSVEQSKPASHSKIGWQTFTDEVIQHLSNHKSGLVFLLWGQHAQSKSKLIDESKHLIIKTAHPSPLSAYQGFLTSNQFQESNTYLAAQNKTPINWQISGPPTLEFEFYV